VIISTRSHFTRKRAITVILGSLIILLVLALGTGTASAAAFAVNSTADAPDANPGDGVCATASGACTLRAAIQEANALNGADVISVPAGTYTLTLGAGFGDPIEPPDPVEPLVGCNVLNYADYEGDLDISCPVTITGAGAGSPGA
jgi:CSLREA domain-containing protein